MGARGSHVRSKIIEVLTKAVDEETKRSKEAGIEAAEVEAAAVLIWSIFFKT